jgi:hypothetical protein
MEESIICEELFEFPKTITENNASINSLYLILDFFSAHQMGPMVSYLSASLNDAKDIPINKTLKRACCSQFISRVEFWHKETKNSGELINFFWDCVIPNDWKCNNDYFLFKDFASHLIMFPFTHGRKEKVPSNLDNKVIRDNYEDVTSNTYYKKKLSKESRDSIAKEFKEVFNQWQHGNSNAGAVEQVQSKYSKSELMRKFHALNDYFREVLNPTPLESLVEMYVPEQQKTKPFEEEVDDGEQEEDEEGEDGAQGFPAKTPKKTTSRERQDEIATQLPSKPILTPVRETRSTKKN